MEIVEQERENVERSRCQNGAWTRQEISSDEVAAVECKWEISMGRFSISQNGSLREQRSLGSYSKRS